MTGKSGFELLKFKLIDKINLKKLVYPGLFLLVFISLSLILSWKYLPTHRYREGVIANREVVASHTFQVEDRQATVEAQNKAMNSVKPVYSIDPFVLNQVEELIEKQFALFSRIHASKKNNKQFLSKELKGQLPISISDDSLHTFTNLNKRILEQLKVMALDIVTGIMKNPIKESDESALKNARKKAREIARGLTLRSNYRNAVADLASEALRANARIDWDETGRLRQLKKDQVSPVMLTIKKGQVIVEKGKIVTPQQIRVLEAMGMHRSTINLSALSGTILFVLISILIIWIYVRQFMPHIAEDPKSILLLALITISTILMCRLFVERNPYWAPIPVAAILLTILLNPKIALLVTAYLSIVVGFFTGDIQYVTVALITGMASILSVSRVHRRYNLVVASIIIFLVNESLVFVFSLVNSEGTRVMVENLVFGGINGFGSGIIAVGLLPILEYLFGITTSMKLLEISNQSEPLLKKLLLEAPGTYHHSVIVGNLAEAAAEAMGEDLLLCRVGAYYHDIGKLRRPYFFIENQLGSENPHDKLSPNLSALIILSHVKDGIGLARKYKLPEPITRIIEQHHGSSIIAYFYHQAKQSDKDFPIEEDFRYPGPKPQSKAAAIVMLADSVEAAARTLDKPTPTKIENLVKQIVHNILEDGQLDESPLSLRDINTITRAFSRILTGIYHQRIEYPDKIMEEMKEPVPFPASKVTHMKRHVG